MRLFNVYTYTFDVFYSEIPMYVVASHRWKGNTETSFQDVQKQRNTHKEGYLKLMGFADYMKQHMPHIDWLWIDTCCIDQRNGAELSEAINSMFKWYQYAEVCLAYLADVGDVNDEHELVRSNWFTRGWTLQELIAPAIVIFLTKDWQAIGQKGGVGRDDDHRSLVPLITHTTGIPEAVLEDCSQLKSIKREDRLRWMDGRSTTREEDKWYCLFGILDVAIGANYGEGAHRAKRRLLAEIKLLDDLAAHSKLLASFSNISKTQAPGSVFYTLKSQAPGSGFYPLESPTFASRGSWVHVADAGRDLRRLVSSGVTDEQLFDAICAFNKSIRDIFRPDGIGKTYWVQYDDRLVEFYCSQLRHDLRLNFQYVQPTVRLLKVAMDKTMLVHPDRDDGDIFGGLQLADVDQIYALLAKPLVF